MDRNHKDLTQWFRDYGSLSARRAWIEILTFPGFGMEIESLSARRAWIEIFSYVGVMGSAVTSLSARRAWIEILT